MVTYSDQHVIVATLGSLIFGIQVSILNSSSNFFPLFYQTCGNSFDYRCDDAVWWMSYVKSSVFLGATVGTLIAGTILSGGRRRALLVGHFISLASAVLCCFSVNFPMFVIARLLSGLCVGILCVAVPTFISEMCTPKVRGSRGTLHQLAITLGILLTLGLGMICTQPPTPESPVYQTYSVPSFEYYFVHGLMLVPGLLSLIAILLTLFVYKDETPFTLISKGKSAEAMTVLNRIHLEKNAAELAFQDIHDSFIEKNGEAKSPNIFALLQTKRNLYVLFIGSVLAIGQQLGGINAFVASSTLIFQNAGWGSDTAAMVSTIMAFVNVFMTIPAVFVIDWLGRRPLLLIGTICQAFCLSVVPIQVLTGWGSLEMASAVAVIGYMVFFALAYGPVLWVYLFEMFPNNMKDVGSAIASCLNWVASVAVVYGSSQVQSADIHRLFYFFAGTSWAVVLFILFTMKETKGTSRSPYGDDIESEETPLISSQV